MFDLSILFASVLNGITTGAVYALIALGLTLIYGVLHIINFAHGASLMVALYGVYFLKEKLGIDPYLALPIMVPAMFALGYVLQRGVINRASHGKDENILLYHGGLNQAERTAVLRRSKETTERTVLLLQLQAGGVGLNLQEYDRIVFMSPWWTAALMDQAIARAVRMGQNKVVHVYHLRLASEKGNTINIDALVNAKAGEKRKQLEKLFQLCWTF